MIKRNWFYLLFCCILFSGCCLESSQEKSAPMVNLDINNDGVQDVFYEDSDGGFYELTDKNFDGKIDQSDFYSNDGIILNARRDENFDGHLESEFIFEGGVLHMARVDVDNDLYADILFFYKYGTPTTSIRFYDEDTLGVIKYWYGYPGREEIKKNKIPRRDFSFGIFSLQDFEEIKETVILRKKPDK